VLGRKGRLRISARAGLHGLGLLFLAAVVLLFERARLLALDPVLDLAPPLGGALGVLLEPAGVGHLPVLLQRQAKQKGPRVVPAGLLVPDDAEAPSGHVHTVRSSCGP
jgi:hypothetical protein